MAPSKKDLIRLVREAQAERDPRRRAELWEEVQEAGLPADATKLEPSVFEAPKGREGPPVSEDKPDMAWRPFLLIVGTAFLLISIVVFIILNQEKIFR